MGRKNKMKTLLTATVLFLTTITASAQEVKKPTSISLEEGHQVFSRFTDGKRVLATTAPTTSNTTTTTIIVVPTLNESGRHVFVASAENGNWAFLGVNEGGLLVTETYLQTYGTDGSPGLWSVLDTGKLQEALPQIDVPVRMVVYHLGVNGQLLDAINVNLLDPNQGTITVLQEGMDPDNNYVITLNVSGGMTQNAIVALGLGFTLPTNVKVLGSVVTLTFPTNAYMPGYGPATLTVRNNGDCHTVVFERKQPINTSY
jgi:hypothetical protein